MNLLIQDLWTFYLVVYNVEPNKVVDPVWLWHDRTLHFYPPKKLEILLWPCSFCHNGHMYIHSQSQSNNVGLLCCTKHIICTHVCQPRDLGEHASMPTNKSWKNNLASFCLTIYHTMPCNGLSQCGKCISLDLPAIGPILYSLSWGLLQIL